MTQDNNLELYADSFVNNCILYIPTTMSYVTIQTCGMVDKQNKKAIITCVFCVWCICSVRLTWKWLKSPKFSNQTLKSNDFNVWYDLGIPGFCDSYTMRTYFGK